MQESKVSALEESKFEPAPVPIRESVADVSAEEAISAVSKVAPQEPVMATYRP